MEKPPIAKCICGAKSIGKFIGENPDRIKYLAQHEGLPVWRRNDKGTWKAIDAELSEWLIKQSLKYRK